MAVEFEVGLVNQDGGAGGAVERGESSYVVDVGVSADDGANFQVVAFQDDEDALDIVSRVDDDSFVRSRVTENRTIALQEAYRDYFVNEVRGHRGQKYSSREFVVGDLWGEIRSKQGLWATGLKERRRKEEGKKEEGKKKQVPHPSALRAYGLRMTTKGKVLRKRKAKA
jgi:hypothetical protein